MVVRIADSIRNTRVDDLRLGVDAGAGAGLLRIYAGSKPGTKGAAPAGLLLAELVCADPCGSSTGGVFTLTVPFSDSSANNTGTAAFFYLVDSTGAYVCEGDCGTSGSDLNLVTLAIIAGQPVQITSMTITDGNA
jgi:hypothetical protein